MKTYLFILSALLFLGSKTQAQSGSQTLINSGDSWKYFAPVDGSQSAAPSSTTAWRGIGTFSDSAWPAGASPLGYSPNNEDGAATIVPTGCGAGVFNCAQKHPAIYFRKTFTITNINDYQKFMLQYKRDDGIVLYVNGTEVKREFMPDGTVAHATSATGGPGTGEGSWQVLDPSVQTSLPLLMYLRTGENVIAAEVHQTGTASPTTNSTDLRFDLKLEGIQKTTPTAFTIARGPYLQMGTASSMIFRWSTDVAIEGRVICKSCKTGVVRTSTWQPTQPSRLESSNTLTLLRTIHSDSVMVDGLEADTPYSYTIEGRQSSVAPIVVLQGGSDNIFQTAPLTGTVTRPIRIWALGDFGVDSTISSAAYSRHLKVRNAFTNYLSRNNIDYVNMWLWLGDNAYDWGTAQEYQRNVFDVYDSRVAGQRIMKQTPIYATPGNHDYHNNKTAAGDRYTPRDYRVQHNLNHYYDVVNNYTRGDNSGVHSGKEEYYSYDYGNIHFVSLDTYGFECDKQPDGSYNCPSGDSILVTTLGSNGQPKSAQVRWLKRDLEKAQQDNRIKWIIVITHYPFYSMGTKDSDTDLEIKPLREKFLKFLEQYKVDMVMTGHSHVYERSKPIRGHYGTESEFIADSLRFLAPATPDANAIGWYARPSAAGSNSMIYFKKSSDPKNYIVHAVSGSGGALGGQKPSWPHAVMQQSLNIGGSMFLEITGNRLDAKFITEDNQVNDQFTIFKDADPLVRAGSNWKYLVSDSAPASVNWKGGGTFDDSGWPQGQAPLGYSPLGPDGKGIDGEVTRVAACPNNPNCSTKSWTTYFRKQFTFNASAHAGTVPVADQRSLILNYRRDDGLVIYLNGREIWRENMPTGTIYHDTPALRAAEPETAWQTVIVSLRGLREGINDIAVEVHQNAQTSSDLHFNLEMILSPYSYDPMATPMSRFALEGASWPQEIAEYKVTVYPNPTLDGKLSFSPALPYQSYILTDIQGKVLKMDNKASTLEHLDIADLPIGLYILVIRGEYGTKWFKIIRN
ncbi:MAG: metallophosphoesterase [Rudanella sp.]|nr:metallophosphoesterase [Rudanella sp.]